MTFYTDYPITELGDTSGKIAPIRECSLISYDGNKYVDIRVEGVEKNIKRSYVYTQHGRCGDVPPATDSELREVISWEER